MSRAGTLRAVAELRLLLLWRRLRGRGGVPELVAHERTGYLGTSDEELAFGLAKLLDEPRAARAMGGRARLRVAGAHAAETLADRLEELYRVVVEERATREAGR
mgnify:CR=1 FL=1